MVYNYEVEKAVLGTLIQFPNTIYAINDSVEENYFYDEANAFIFHCIKKVAKKSKVDLLTVANMCNELKGSLKNAALKEYKWALTVSKLTTGISSSHNLEEHIEILRVYRAKRLLLDASQKVMKHIDEGKSIQDIINDLSDTLTTAANTKSSTEVDIKQGLKEFIENQERSLTEKLMPTYIPEVDQVIGGFEYSDLIIVAGAASMGKTSFMLKLLQNFLNNNKSVAIFSLEMSNNQLLTRLMSMETEIKVRNIRYNNLDSTDWDKINGTIAKLETKSFVMDGQTTALSDVINKIKKLKIKNNIDVVFIDYLQLITAGGKSREQEVAKIARSLKNIAKEMNIVVVALSQLSRALMQRDNKRPMLSDLRESGEIEQAADTIMFAFREEYYTMDNPREIQDAEIIIAKGRNVGVGTAYLKFRPDIVKFLSPELDIKDKDVF